MPSRARSAARLGGLAVAAAALVAPFGVGAAGAATNDPLAGKQYGPAQVHAEQAWTTSRGAGATVAVIDSGVDLTHPDLAGQLVPGATFVSCASSCGNGDWKGPDGVGQPNDAHGTHVSGIVAAATGNGLGIAGVAPDAKVMPVKVLEDGSGSFEDIAAGIRWAADHGADVVNMSLGGTQGTQALVLTGLVTDVQDAVAYARSKDVVVVAAAGNDSVPLCNTPGFDEGVLCVTATDRRELPAAYSSGAIRPDLRSVAAPGGSLVPVCGEDILSTVPQGTGGNATCGTPAGYDEFAGTSMATPHVAGVAALLVAQGRTAENVVATLLSTARKPVTGTRGVWDPKYGYGIVDAAAAVSTPVG